jgi:hypothetical protein
MYLPSYLLVVVVVSFVLFPWNRFSELTPCVMSCILNWFELDCLFVCLFLHDAYFFFVLYGE